MIAPVAYIDLQPGEQSGFVRCKSTEGATQILNKYGPNETSSDVSVTLLTGLYHSLLSRVARVHKILRVAPGGSYPHGGPAPIIVAHFRNCTF